MIAWLSNNNTDYLATDSYHLLSWEELIKWTEVYTKDIPIRKQWAVKLRQLAFLLEQEEDDGFTN